MRRARRARFGIAIAPLGALLVLATAPRASAQSPVATTSPTIASSTSDRARSEAMRAYQRALEAQKLAAAAPLSTARLKEELATIEAQIRDGRRDEAIAALVYLVESPRFAPFERTEEGRAALFLLGDSLARAGASDAGRVYLVRLLDVPATDTWSRRAAETLVDVGLESDHPERALAELDKIALRAPPEVAGDIEYLRGRAAEVSGRPEQASAAYARVSQRSRFWAQATYLAGVLEVEQKHFKRGEELFCKIADPKRMPREAALFGGSDFFRVRDLSRLGLGRIAHEQYRFDDARYYYYLVPNDSERLPEALYETATTRYEAKDYRGAREAIDDLSRLAVDHPYQDEAWILDAYIDLAQCRFAPADAKLREFIKRYEPARDAVRKLANDPAAMRRFAEAVHRGSDPAAVGLGVSDDIARSLAALLRVDQGYLRAGRRLAQVEHQLAGLRGALGELDEARRKLANGGELKPETREPLAREEKLQRIHAQIAELKRVLRDAKRAVAPSPNELSGLQRELEALEMRERALAAEPPSTAEGAPPSGADLGALIAGDRERASALYRDAERMRGTLEAEQGTLAGEAFQRLDRRLTRLLNRARLGRIETVLGKKRALEVEVEALSQGLLPQTIVDSLRAERYLESDEEFWPFEGEDWDDEYVGGEGLR